jgi:hypothetical protein
VQGTRRRRPSQVIDQLDELLAVEIRTRGEGDADYLRHFPREDLVEELMLKEKSIENKLPTIPGYEWFPKKPDKGVGIKIEVHFR